MVLSSQFTIGRVEPLLSLNMKVDWFNKSADTTIVRNAEACDMAFFISRHLEEGIRTGWTNFNKVKRMVDSPLTTVWYMPIIQAPGKRKMGRNCQYWCLCPQFPKPVLNSFHVGAPPRVSTHAVSAGNHAYHVQCNASVKLAIIYVAIIIHLWILEIIDFSHHTVFTRNSQHFMDHWLTD